MLKRQQGLSLLETSILFIVSALIVMTAVHYYQLASDQHKTQLLINEINTATQKINQLYSQLGTNADYSQLNNALVIGAGGLATLYTTNNNSISNPFHGSLVIANYNGSSYMKGYIITTNNIPASQCVKLLTAHYTTGLESIALAGIEQQIFYKSGDNDQGEFVTNPIGTAQSICIKDSQLTQHKTMTLQYNYITKNTIRIG